MEYLPITEINPERDVLRCLPSADAMKQNVLAWQGAFGIGAYDGGRFVGSLWFYRVEDLAVACPYAPDWSGWSASNVESDQLALVIPPDSLPLLGLSCFHVGRTKALEAQDRNDAAYYHKGVGTALLATALQWAAQRDYRSVVAMGGMDNLPAFNNWAGMLPLKVFLRSGFTVLRTIDPWGILPDHLRCEADALEGKLAALATVIKHVA